MVHAVVRPALDVAAVLLLVSQKPAKEFLDSAMKDGRGPRRHHNHLPLLRLRPATDRLEAVGLCGHLVIEPERSSEQLFESGSPVDLLAPAPVSASTIFDRCSLPNTASRFWVYVVHATTVLVLQGRHDTQVVLIDRQLPVSHVLLLVLARGEVGRRGQDCLRELQDLLVPGLHIPAIVCSPPKPLVEVFIEPLDVRIRSLHRGLELLEKLLRGEIIWPVTLDGFATLHDYAVGRDPIDEVSGIVIVVLVVAENKPPLEGSPLGDGEILWVHALDALELGNAEVPEDHVVRDASDAPGLVVELR
mmetsp:Transcript_72696/g.201592  ORF Transcript_72696/g.201592 Transcript_72696/m.201592 type:complete len:304 (-) Transcript_72696:202-1113(-)